MIYTYMRFAIAAFFLALIQNSVVFANPSQPLVPVGRVVWVEGTLMGALPGKANRNLEKSAVIYLHDTLTTDSKSKAEIVFSDDSLMTFRPSTKFVIDQYDFQPKNEKGSLGKSIMKLLEGGFRTITGWIAKDNPSNYLINTPVATLSVRGTDYDTAVMKDSAQKIQVFLGRNESMGNSSPCITSSSQTLCLDDHVPYAEVTNGRVPRVLKTRPSVFDEKLKIIKATIQSCDAPTDK